MTPRVSIITAVFNGKTFLLDCLSSVAHQRGIALEHILIDGGSTDGTLDLIKRHDRQLAFWSSEPDGGIADAMNKGIRRATGEWLLFLHADDFLAADDHILLECADVADDSGADVAAFPVLFGSPPALRRLDPKHPDWRLNLKMGMCHQGILTKRALFEKMGPYRTDFRMDMDYEFLLRAYRGDARMESFSDPVLAVMRDTGISSATDWNSERRRFLEERMAHLLHAKGLFAVVAYHAWWTFYMPFRWLRSWTRGSTRSP